MVWRRVRFERKWWPWASWGALTLGVLGLALAAAYAPLLRGDPRREVLVQIVPEAQAPDAGWARALAQLNKEDVTFAAWLVSRHARTWLTRPWQLLATEQCAPAERTIKLGPPMISLGLLAAPAWLVTRDPILTYNAAVFLMPIVGALAVFLLVADWTRVPTAAFVASAAYGTSPAVFADVSHPFVRDLAWTALALFFARRWLEGSGWPTALGLALCVPLQVGSSSYSLLTALFLAPPLAVWLLLRHGLARLTALQVAAALAIAALGTGFVLFPYLEARGMAEIEERSLRFYLDWSEFLPGGERYPGTLVLLLACAGSFVAPRRFAPRLGDPRLALWIATVLVALASTGGNAVARARALASGETPPFAIPDLYAWAAGFLPLLDSVRGVLNLAVGVHLLLCLIAGLGAAACLSASSRRLRPLVSTGLVVAVVGAAIPASWLGSGEAPRFETLAIRPDAQRLDLFTELREQGNSGPIVEFPPVTWTKMRAGREASRILASAWHGRRTSACFGSFAPTPERRALNDVLEQLPTRASLAALSEQGFTTILLYEEGRRFRRFEAAAAEPRAALRLLHVASPLSAWSLPPSPAVDR